MLRVTEKIQWQHQLSRYNFARRFVNRSWAGLVASRRFHSNAMSNTCFVISPFGEPFDDYYEKIYKPAIEKADLQAIRADEVYGTGAIIEDIFAQIVTAQMVICEATGKNPNVNYELGVAHALQKPAIIITQSIADVPFDYKHLRVITYDQKKVNWAQELEAAISKTILAVLSDPERAMA